jgi:hypothetical protein
VNLFVEHAREIMEAAESASGKGNGCSEMTILIGQDGALRLIKDSDWPLDSLAHHHGAKSAYRVSEQRGSVRVEGREGMRTCLLQSVSPAETARRLLAAR